MRVLDRPPPGSDRPRRYVLPLLERRSESPSAITFRFSTKGSGFAYRSTQAVRLALPGVDDPWGAARMLSLSSSPTEPGILSVTCRISETPFKAALAALRPGDTAEVYGPLGEFLLDRSRPSVFLAGGIGITPFRGMLRYAADEGDTTERRLLYSARSPEELLFRTEMDEIARTHPNMKLAYTVTRDTEPSTSWSGRTGRIDARWIRECAASLDHPKYYVAGLPAMVSEVMGMLLRQLAVPESEVDYEVFHGF